MTKAQMAKKVEALVEAIAVAHGAVVQDKEIIVGGRKTTSREAVGGLFDLDGARNVLARNLAVHAETLKIVNLPALAVDGPRLVNGAVVGAA